MSQIDQVTVVRQNLVGRETIFFTPLFEQIDILLCKGCRHPLTLVLGEKGKCLGSYCMCIDRCILYTTGCADVCSYEFHLFIFLAVNFSLATKISDNGGKNEIGTIFFGR